MWHDCQQNKLTKKLGIQTENRHTIPRTNLRTTSKHQCETHHKRPAFLILLLINSSQQSDLLLVYVGHVFANTACLYYTMNGSISTMFMHIIFSRMLWRNEGLTVQKQANNKITANICEVIVPENMKITCFKKVRLPNNKEAPIIQ